MSGSGDRHKRHRNPHKSRRKGSDLKSTESSERLVSDEPIEALDPDEKDVSLEETADSEHDTNTRRKYAAPVHACCTHSPRSAAAATAARGDVAREQFRSADSFRALRCAV